LDLSITSISGPCLELLLSHCAMLRNLSLENAELNDIICSAISGKFYVAAKLDVNQSRNTYILWIFNWIIE
jgi:hypothetical protein